MPDNFGFVRRLEAPGQYVDVDLFTCSVFEVTINNLDPLVIAGVSGAVDVLRPDPFCAVPIRFNTPVLLDPNDFHSCEQSSQGYKGIRPGKTLIIGAGDHALSTCEGRFPRLSQADGLKDEHLALYMVGNTCLRVINLAARTPTTVKNLAALSLGDTQAP